MQVEGVIDLPSIYLLTHKKTTQGMDKMTISRTLTPTSSFIHPIHWPLRATTVGLRNKLSRRKQSKPTCPYSTTTCLEPFYNA